LTTFVDKVERRWTLAYPDKLAWADWGPAVSLFDGISGETHLLDALTAEIVRRLAKDALTLEELSQALSTDCEVTDTALWQRKVAAVLEQLRALQLAEQL
jgi:PqqD family protein of HPr-rel-A system